jgi:hypothetical protein
MDTVIQRDVDLAGHYIFVHGSAGGNSALYNAVDAKTGFIYPFPYDLKVMDNWQYEHQSDHRKESRLLIMHGLLFDGPKTLPEIPFGEHYFLFEKQRFKYIGSVLMSNPEGKLARGVHVLAMYKNTWARTFKGGSGQHSYEVTLTAAPFNPKAHHLSHPEYGGLEVDGVDSNPGSMEVPVAELRSFEVKVDGKRWPIPPELWKNCFDPCLADWPGSADRPEFKTMSAKLSRDGRILKVAMRGGFRRYGSDFQEYNVVWGLSLAGEDYAKVED